MFVHNEDSGFCLICFAPDKTDHSEEGNLTLFS